MRFLLQVRRKDRGTLRRRFVLWERRFNFCGLLLFPTYPTKSQGKATIHKWTIRSQRRSRRLRRRQKSRNILKGALAAVLRCKQRHQDKQRNNENHEIKKLFLPVIWVAKSTVPIGQLRSCLSAQKAQLRFNSINTSKQKRTASPRSGRKVALLVIRAARETRKFGKAREEVTDEDRNLPLRDQDTISKELRKCHNL